MQQQTQTAAKASLRAKIGNKQKAVLRILMKFEIRADIDKLVM